MTKDAHHIRAFIAILLPEQVKRFLSDRQRMLRQEGIAASFTKPAAMHLTLKFLGNIDMLHIDIIKKCMETAATGTSTHTLFSSGIGVFPSVKNARVIWSGARGQTDILEKLVSSLESSLFEKMGIKKENKRFSPHFTLARITSRVSPEIIIRLIRESKDLSSDTFPVSGFHLFKSELTSSGAIHNRVLSVRF